MLPRTEAWINVILNPVFRYSKYGTVLPAIQREEALVRIIVKYVKFTNYAVRIKDTWPLFRLTSLV